jgi:gamma-glutamyltranspeptidase/glutathione hydrolase
VGLRALAAGGSAADAAVAAVLAGCAAETVLTGLAGGGFAIYYDARSRAVTCLDFFVAVPGLDGDAAPWPMTAIKVTFGGVPLEYSIGAPSVCVPGVPAGCGEVHRRWGRLPWRDVVRPAVELARTGAPLPEPQAGTLAACAEAMLPGEGASAYAPLGRLLSGGHLLRHPGLDRAMEMLAVDGPEVFYGGRLGALMVRTVRRGGGVLGPADLAAYRVAELPVRHACFAGAHVYGRDDFNGTVAALAALPDLRGMSRADRVVALARTLGGVDARRLGDTTNICTVDAEGNACVVTTTLGLGAGVWLPDLGVHLNSMLGEGELRTAGLTPGRRMASMMCPLIVTAEPARHCDPAGPSQTREPAGPAGSRGLEPSGAGQPGAGQPAAGQSEAGQSEAGQESNGQAGAGQSGAATLGGAAAAPLLAAGSAGASRIRSALVQTLTGVLVDGRSVTEAISGPRFHVVRDVAHTEPGFPAVERAALEAAGYQENAWPDRNHYFGGVSAVGGRASRDAAGDPRRGGAGALLDRDHDANM